MRGIAVAAMVMILGAAALAEPVDDARLAGDAAEGADWLTYGNGYGNQRFSGLEQINRDTVSALVPRWIYQTGISATFQASPLVADGVMYVTTPRNHVVALDAASGKTLWRYAHEMITDKLCCGPANRGAAMGYGAVYQATADGRLLALDQESGEVRWDVTIAVLGSAPSESLDQLAEDDPLRDTEVAGASELGASMAPLVHDGLVIAGVTGAGYGLHVGADAEGEVGAVVGFEGRFGKRGYMAAYDAATGAEVWRWYTTRTGGWEGEFRETTPAGAPLHRDIATEKATAAQYADAWQVGGGSLWSTPALDPDLGLIYFGTGNPAPQMDDVSRPGDNLYTVSLVAVDVRTGELRWHYQHVPHDRWGYDVASPPVLFDVVHEGAIVQAVGEASKTGWYYVNDRVTGKLLYLSEPFVPQRNIFARPTEEGVTIAPGAAGGASWSPTAFDPHTGFAYVAGLHMPTTFTVQERPATDTQPALRYSVLRMADEPRWGVLSAIDTRDRGSIRWQAKTDSILVGGVLATAGGLVFMGEGDGNFNAYDSATGELVWTFYCGAGVNAPPVSYEIGGVQYVAVAAGGHQMFGFPTGDAVIAFALPQ